MICLSLPCYLLPRALSCTNRLDVYAVAQVGADGRRVCLGPGESNATGNGDRGLLQFGLCFQVTTQRPSCELKLPCHSSASAFHLPPCPSFVESIVSCMIASVLISTVLFDDCECVAAGGCDAIASSARRSTMTSPASAMCMALPGTAWTTLALTGGPRTVSRSCLSMHVCT